MEQNQNEAPSELLAFSGRTHLIVNDEQLEAVSSELLRATALGFDTETKPSFKKGDVFKVALLQLATKDTAYLIRTHTVTKFEILRQIFEDKNVLKVGVAIQQDLKQLQAIFRFTPQNFIELQKLAKEKGLKNFGLKGMAEEVLKARITKGPKLTNWEAPTLTEKQITYAATDAWLGLKLYQALIARPAEQS